MSCFSTVFPRRPFMAAIITGALVVSASALAQFGEKAVRIILPNATGSGVDTITRTVQPALAKALGMPVVVENQAGAGGVVGLQALTRSAPDGMTLSVVSNNVVIFPSVLRSLPFALPADVTPIAIVGFIGVDTGYDSRFGIFIDAFNDFFNGGHKPHFRSGQLRCQSERNGNHNGCSSLS